MNATEQVWLVYGRAALADHAALWALCEGCKAFLGGGWMAIGEHATGLAIQPWTHFPKEAWTRGRFSGSAGEVQWRTYGPLVRAVILVEVPDQAKGQEAKAQLQACGFSDLHVKLFDAEQDDMYLQTNDEEYTRAAVHRYGTPDEPDLFVRYGRIQAKKVSSEASQSNEETEQGKPT